MSTKPPYDGLPAAYKAVNIASGWVNQWMMAAYDTTILAAYKTHDRQRHPGALFPNNFMIAAYRGAFAIYDAEGRWQPGIQEDLRPLEALPCSEINEWHKTAEAAMTNFLGNWRAGWAGIG